MSSFQETRSSLLSDNVPNMKTQVFLPKLEDQNMKSTPLTIKEPVSVNDVKPSSSAQHNQKFICVICGKTLSRKDALTRHIKFHSENKPFICVICDKTFSQKSDLQRHTMTHSNPKILHNCNKCNEIFSKKFDLLKHRKIHKSPKQHNCDLCNEIFSRKFDLLKHRKNHKYPKQYNCELCNTIFLRKYDLLKHKKIHSIPKQYKCYKCSNVFNNKSKLLHHLRTLHSVPTKRRNSSLKGMLYEKVKHFKRENALNVFTKTTINSNENNDKDFHIFFNSIRSDVLNELSYQMEEKRRLKWYATVQVVVNKMSQEGGLETVTPYFHSKTILQLVNDNLSTHIDDAFAKINNSFEKFIQRGSGWTLEKILYFEVSTAKYCIS